MGWYEVTLTLRGVRSAHNSLQDRLDQAKWEYLRERIERMINAEEGFASLRIEITGPTE